MASRNDVYPELRGLRPTIPPDPDALDHEARLYEHREPEMTEHSQVTTDRERPLPREMGPHPRSWALIGVTAVLMMAALVLLLFVY